MATCGVRKFHATPCWEIIIIKYGDECWATFFFVTNILLFFFKQGEFTIFTTAKRLTAESHPKNFPPEGLFVFYLFICAQDRLNAERKSVPFCMVILYF